MRNTNLLLKSLVVIFAVMLSSAVCFYGYLQKVPSATYSGIRSMNASDFNANGAWLMQARDGKFVFENPFTSEKQHPFLVRPFYVAISLPFHWSDLSTPVILHIWRVIFSVIVLVLLFPLIRTFEKNSQTIYVAYALLAFTSGAGYFFSRIAPSSADLQIPEAFLFLTLGEVPHFQYSILLFWSAMASMYLYAQNHRNALILYLICLGLLWWDHPFDAITLTVLSTISLWLYDSWRKKIRFLILTALLSLPAVLYYLWLTKLPFAQGAAEQNILPSPQLAALATAFLPITMLSVIGTAHQLKNPEHKRVTIFLVAWISIQFLLAYSPVPFQRRLISGVQFPLAILAAVALTQKIRNRVVIIAIIILLSCTNLFIVKTQIQELHSKQMPFYLPNAYTKAFQWLSEQKKEGSVIAAFVTSNFIPAHSGFKAFWGHSQLTPRSSEKRQAVQDFFRRPDPEFLRKHNIRYVFLGWEERMYNLPELKPPFVTVYSDQNIRIYELQPDGFMYNVPK
ncbi:MAG TPA: hypothetical protein VLH08_11370 [Acidobacteriota bacterium]|nr:hypothetical protein [Acidobacteriota bacterium]